MIFSDSIYYKCSPDSESENWSIFDEVKAYEVKA